MLSSTDVYNHDTCYGEVKLSCTVYLTKGIHDPSNEIFLHQVCALLNSGGGLISMKNADIYKNVLPKHLDLWWSGMESCIARIQSTDDIVNFVDFVGNFDDKYFYLFVKSAEHFCTIDYYCRLPTDTATHEVTYKSAIRLCQRQRSCESLKHLPAIPERFEYGRTEETLKQEGKQIQFKLVTSRKETGSNTLANKVSHYSSRYISAFANHEGGHVYFGIEDETAGVYGEVMRPGDEAEIVDNLDRRLKSMIWSDTKFVPQRGVHWEIRFRPVFNHMQEIAERAVIIVSVCKMTGGVFTACPESYIVTRQSMTSHQPFVVHKPKFDEWKTLLLNQTRDCLSLHTRFLKLPLLTPQCRLTFSLPQTLQSAREKIIKLTTGLNFHPRNIIYCLDHPYLKHVITQLLGMFDKEDHLAFAMDSWGLSLPLTPSKPDIIQICIAIFSLSGIHVVSLVEGNLRDGAERQAWMYTCDMAVNLKQSLVNHGGCVSHLAIKVHVVDIASKDWNEAFGKSVNADIYPQTYRIRQESMHQILNSLTIAIASYKPFGNNNNNDGDTDHYFLLTSDQFELLWTNQCTKELWVHGPPGAGKTVAAMEMVKEFRRRGNKQDEVLYVAENSLICSYVQSFDICLVVSRRGLMDDATNSDLLNSKYGQVKNVIVDEAQNFKSRDGDWYGLLEKISRQNVVDGQFDMSAGYYWLFMDYAQKVHKFEAGLPGLIGKNNFMLSEISRNSKEIFEYASKFMDKKPPVMRESSASSDKAMQVQPVLGHQFSSGQGVSVVKCDKSNMHDVLFQVLKTFSEDGVEFDDMAILVSKKKDSEAVKDSIKKTGMFGSMSVNPPTQLSKSHESNLSARVDSSMNDGTYSSMESRQDLYPAQSSSVGSGTVTDKSVSISESESSPGSSSNQTAQQEQHPSNEEATVTNTSPPLHPPLQGRITTGDSTAAKSDPVLVSTVREFSGLDKSVVVGMEPHTNPDHADLEKMILNMATRARDSLVILTTSDNLMEVLKPQK